MVTKGSAWASTSQHVANTRPSATSSLVLGIVLALVIGLLGIHAFSDTAPTSGASAASQSAAQSGAVVAGSSLSAELAAVPPKPCADPCALPAPAPDSGELSLLMLCALALLVALTLLLPPAFRGRFTTARSAAGLGKLPGIAASHAPPPLLHTLSVCRT